MKEIAVPWGQGASPSTTAASSLPRKHSGVSATRQPGREIEQRTARTRGDRAPSLRQRVDAHAGGVLALRGVLVPAALAEGEEDGRVGDAVAVVADGDADGGGSPVLLDGFGGDGDAGGAATPRVLDQLCERLGEPGIEEAGDAVDGAVVDAGPDRGGDTRAGQMGRIGHGGGLP